MVYYVGNDTNNPVIIPDNMRPIGSGREGVVYNVGGLAVISNTNNLVNVLDPDRYLTMEDSECYFSTHEQFEKENVYWVNKLWYSLFYQMIEQSANYPGADYRKFRFYMREKLDSAMELRYVPSLIKSEVKDFDTVNDYMVYKFQYTKSKDLLRRY